MPTDRDPIYVAAACNERYAMPLAAMLASVGATLASGREVIAYVLESDLSAATKAKIKASIGKAPIELIWLAVDSAPLTDLQDGFRPFDWFTVEIYYRLLLPDRISTDIDKIIYLDCDLVLNHDLGELWDVEIGEAYVLAIPDADEGARLVSSPKGVRFYRELGLASDLKFFNSGVLVINLRRWRQDRLPLRVATYLREAGDDVLWYDQEALNAAMAGEWTALDRRWNLMVPFLGRESTDSGTEPPFIVHFTGSTKPWHIGYPYRYRALFFEHLDRTAWAGWRPRQLPLSAARRVAKLVLKAIRKRWHALNRHLARVRQWWHARQVLRRPLRQLDPDSIPEAGQSEIRLFVVDDGPGPLLPNLLGRYFRHGCDRMFVALRCADSQIRSLIEEQPRAHGFGCADEPRSDHEILRHLLHVHGRGHWCLIVGASELLATSDGATGSLKALGDRLEADGFGALRCRVIENHDDPRSTGWRSPTTGLAEPEVENDFRKIRTIARDPLTKQVFGTLVEVASDAPWVSGAADRRTRVVLLRFRPEMSMTADLQAVSGFCEADRRGVVLRFSDPTALSGR